MRIQINRQGKAVLIDAAKVDLFTVEITPANSWGLFASLTSGRKEQICERPNAEGCFREYDDISRAERLSVEQNREDLVAQVAYLLPPEPAKAPEGTEGEPKPEKPAPKPKDTPKA